MGCHRDAYADSRCDSIACDPADILVAGGASCMDRQEAASPLPMKSTSIRPSNEQRVSRLPATPSSAEYVDDGPSPDGVRPAPAASEQGHAIFSSSTEQAIERDGPEAKVLSHHHFHDQSTDHPSIRSYSAMEMLSSPVDCSESSPIVPLARLPEGRTLPSLAAINDINQRDTVHDLIDGYDQGFSASSGAYGAPV